MIGGEDTGAQMGATMRIAVTGGTGLFGRAVVDLALARGHGVVEIDRVAPERSADAGTDRVFRQADVTSYPDLLAATEGCDALVHLAAHIGANRAPEPLVHNDNVVGSYNALSVAARLGIARVCLASSVNAIGGLYSRRPRYDYFPLDERHPCYSEDPYSLSKWIAETQADSFARRCPEMSIASLRVHFLDCQVRRVVREDAKEFDAAIRDLWGYTLLAEAARAVLLGLTKGPRGHEVFYIVAPTTGSGIPSEELRREFYPEVPVRGELTGDRGFFDCGKAGRLLGWYHPPRG